MVNTKQVVTFVVIAFVIFFVLQNPSRAADYAHGLGNGISWTFNRLSQFLSDI